LKSLFKAGVEVGNKGDEVTLHLGDAAIFTNYLGIKGALDKLPAGKTVRLDFARTVVVDHSVMQNLHHFEEDYARAGGSVKYLGLDQLTPMSAHPHAARRRRGKSTKSKQ